jgi:membrane-bound acyltransferase YfiQ involved in biofilm formation
MGVAILAVVLNHAAGWGEIAMFNWADRYRAVTVPNYDQLSSVSYYVLQIIRQLALFSVPAFLFGSGFFVAFAARGTRGNFTWKMVRVRLFDLLVPYLLWSCVWFVTDALQGKIYPIGDYLWRLLVGKAEGGSYYFIPLLCQFYLLSPFLVPLARTRPKLLLAIAGLIQAVTFGINYLILLQVNTPVVTALGWVTDGWLFFLWAFYFPFGIVCGLHGEHIKAALARYFRPFLFATIVAAILTIIEPEIFIRWNGTDVSAMPTLSATAYAILLILIFVIYDRIKVPRAKTVYNLGAQSYGIYLIHLKAMEFASRIMRQVTPGVLAYQVLLVMPINFVIGLAVPLIMMKVVEKSPARRVYHYIFG